MHEASPAYWILLFSMFLRQQNSPQISIIYTACSMELQNIVGSVLKDPLPKSSVKAIFQ